MGLKSRGKGDFEADLQAEELLEHGWGQGVLGEKRKSTCNMFGLLWSCPEAARNTCLQRAGGQKVSAWGQVVLLPSREGALQEGEMREPTNKLW